MRAPDEPAVQMQALKGLWQYWFWTPDTRVKDRIEDTFLQAMAAPQHPWVDRNLRERHLQRRRREHPVFLQQLGPVAGDTGDRASAIQGRLAVEERLADKFAKVLETGSDAQRKTLLAGLTEYLLAR